jgi:hypothetical protein
MNEPRSYEFSKGVRGEHPGISHTNREGKTYHLQHGTDKRGKARYWFGQKITGEIVRELPAGHEIYEKPVSAQVFLRPIEASVILPAEVELVRRAVTAQLGEGMAIVDLEGKYRREIVVYTTDLDVDERVSALDSMFPGAGGDTLRNLMFRNRSFHQILRFTLTDAEARRFQAERWCFLGSIDTWFPLKFGEPLKKLMARYVPHLGRESFYDLM